MEKSKQQRINNLTLTTLSECQLILQHLMSLEQDDNTNMAYKYQSVYDRLDTTYSNIKKCKQAIINPHLNIKLS